MNVFTRGRVRWEGCERGERGNGEIVSRVVMGGCRHSFPLVGERKICGRRRGEGRCHSRGNGLDGLFGAENQGVVSEMQA